MSPRRKARKRSQHHHPDRRGARRLGRADFFGEADGVPPDDLPGCFFLPTTRSACSCLWYRWSLYLAAYDSRQRRVRQTPLHFLLQHFLSLRIAQKKFSQTMHFRIRISSMPFNAWTPAQKRGSLLARRRSAFGSEVGNFLIASSHWENVFSPGFPGHPPFSLPTSTIPWRILRAICTNGNSFGVAARGMELTSFIRAARSRGADFGRDTSSGIFRKTCWTGMLDITPLYMISLW